ncbi:MAG: DUF4339 domain-containing protein [Pseudomonadota bacterium]
MSDTDTSQAVWYLARDGQQYGPIQDDELRKLVELKHLQDGDLVWSPAYTEWQPASVVIELFSSSAAPLASAAPEPAAPDPQTATPTSPEPATAFADTTSTRPQHLQQQTTDPNVAAAASAASAAAGFSASDNRAKPRPEPAMREALDSDTYRPGGPAPAPAQAPAPAASTGYRRADPYAGQPEHDGYGRSPNAPHLGGAGRRESYDTGPRSAAASASGPAAPHPAARPHDAGYGETRARTPAPETHGRHVAIDDDPYDTSDERGGGWIKAAAAIVVLGLVGAGGWFAYEQREQILAAVMDGGSETGSPPVVRAGDTSGRAPTQPVGQGATGRAQPQQTAAAAQPAARDIALMKTGLWQTIEKSFPGWATARRAEVAEFQAAGRSTAFVERHLVSQMAEMRRENATAALSSSPTALKSVASAFLTNLRTLSSRSVDTCYAFISSGETSPKILPLMSDPQASEALRKQMRVVVDAIVDGRANPKTYLPPRQSDFSVISGELTKMGWTSADMRLFGDPQALAKAPAAKVCQLVTDWFTAQLLVPDPQIQSRLLVQSLRPVVAG